MNDALLERRATFARMDQGSEEDWAVISAHNGAFARGLADRVIEHLDLLKADAGGFAVDRFEHSLQTATLAANAGKDDEYIVCALLHDIGDTLGSFNHADIAATILEPFVSEENHWIVKHHGIFQGYYFFHYIGLDRNLRDRYVDHEYYEPCAAFCRLDQVAFDPDFKSAPLSDFEPMVRKLFAAPKRSLYMADASA